MHPNGHISANYSASERPGPTTARSHYLSVFNIQRSCVHDGPGIRTVVFFQGCNMCCRWCQNPESRSWSDSGPQARMSVRQILETVRRDRIYYEKTGGGVTLGGGEAMMQKREPLAALVKALHQDGIHVAVETAGDAPWTSYEAVLPSVDLFLFDLKYCGNDDVHLGLTGRHSALPHSNLRKLVAAGARVAVRMCVVPGYNDTPENITATSSLLKNLGIGQIELLRYYNVHEAKARRLDIATSQLGIDAATAAAALQTAAGLFEKEGISATVPTGDRDLHNEPFSERITELKNDIRGAGYHLCMESAEMKTRYYRRHGFGGHVGLKRANLLRYLLNNKKINVFPRELLVGNFTSKRVGAQMWVEYFGSAAVGNVYDCDRQTPVPFQCTRAEKARYYLDTATFWSRNSLITKVFPTYRELGLFAARVLEKKVGFHNNMSGVSHFVVNNDRLLRLGTSGIREEVERAMSQNPAGTPDFYRSLLISLTAVEEFAERYAMLLKKMARKERNQERRSELEDMAAVCARVPKYPATTFHEALQSILFMEIALCIEAFENAISFGRLDRILGPYLEADLAAGRITRERARDLIGCFVLKIDEIIFFNDGDTGFQLGKLFETLSPVETITVGGVDEDGRDVTNDVTFMILDACRLNPVSVNMAARIHTGSPDAYVRRIAEVYLSGTPMPELFCDEAYIPALMNNYPMVDIRQARNYSIVGCVEPCASDQHFGNTDCANVNVTMPFLQALYGDEEDLWKFGILKGIENKALDYARTRLFGDRAPDSGKRPANGRRSGVRNPPGTMDELMGRFEKRMNQVVASVLADHYMIETALAKHLSVPLATSMYSSAIKSGKDVLEGGAHINTSGIQAVGITDVADSLHAIDQLVFRSRSVSMDRLLDAMEANFEGPENEPVREMLLAVPKFGNDSSPEAAGYMNRVLDIWTAALRNVPKNTRNGRYVAGYYGLNVNMAYGTNTPALPSGRLQGVPLANSLIPHYGMKMVDLTSALNAVSGVDFAKYAPNGTTNTATIDAGMFAGDQGVTNLTGLIRGYFEQGGMQFQPNVVSREMLLDAYRNPDRYPDLLVRIAGYCALFKDLSDELKLEIINRTYYSSSETV